MSFSVRWEGLKIEDLDIYLKILHTVLWMWNTLQ